MIRLSPHLRGHFFLFDARRGEPYSPSAATRLLIAAVALELTRLAAVPWFREHLPRVPLPLLLATFIGLALLAVVTAAGLHLRQIGLRSSRDWTPTEKSYFLQVTIGANFLFLLLFATPLRHRVAQSGLTATFLGVFLPYLFFGFYQELVYRGMLQSALTHRWGRGPGCRNHQQPLHLRPTALELHQLPGRDPDVRRDLRHRPAVRDPLREIGESLDRRRISCDRECVHRDRHLKHAVGAHGVRPRLLRPARQPQVSPRRIAADHRSAQSMPSGNRL